MTIDHYSTLRVSQDASITDISRAFKSLALVSHPDKVPPEHKDIATANFQKVKS